MGGRPAKRYGEASGTICAGPDARTGKQAVRNLQAKQGFEGMWAEGVDHAYGKGNARTGGDDCAGWDAGAVRGRERTSGHRNFGGICAAGNTSIRTADLPRRRIPLDPRILGVGRRRWGLLLGSWDVGTGTGAGLFVDAGILGLGRQRILFSRRLLGAANRILWRGEFFIWLFFSWLFCGVLGEG